MSRGHTAQHTVAIEGREDSCTFTHEAIATPEVWCVEAQSPDGAWYVLCGPDNACVMVSCGEIATLLEYMGGL